MYTGVTALEEGYEYMVEYQTTCEASGRVEPVVGGFFSFPVFSSLSPFHFLVFPFSLVLFLVLCLALSLWFVFCLP